MKRYFPKSLTGQLIAVLLLALVVAQIASFLILNDDRRLAFLFSAQQQVMTRTATVVHTLNKSDPATHSIILEAASGPRLKFSLSDQAAVEDGVDIEGFDRFLQRTLAWELDDSVRSVRVAVVNRDDDDDKDHDDDDADDADDDDDDDDDDENKDERLERNRDLKPRDGRWFKSWREGRHQRSHFNRRRYGSVSELTLALETNLPGPDTIWLNVHSRVPPAGPAIAIPSLITMAIMAVLLVIIVIFMVRRTTRPLELLTDRAERFGRGENIGLLPENGPQDIRKATRAFNLMQERLTRFVKDRTLLLAAITHDLRTPITALRIRAEMLEEGENRERILETLAEMQELTEATLEFARQEASEEKSRTVDLIALVEAVCADQTDLGHDVTFASEIDRLPYACHPIALKRILRNLIENAVRYGDRARVGFSASTDALTITVEDDGPGIAAENQARIFEPFVRLEESRNRETGGIGLGLAIARTLARAHGGEVELANTNAGGARFIVTLPAQ
jgi:signal transduction histidine kinase